MNKQLLLLGLMMINFILPFSVNAQVTDIDGNTYRTIFIGNQNWLRDNLKTTKFNDGTAIPLVADTSWMYQTTPAYCYFMNESNSSFGVLYNWYDVNTGKLCPEGFHVPSEAKWQALVQFIGEECLKQKLTTGSGFAAGLYGFRSGNSRYFGIGISTGWWSSTEKTNNGAYSFDLNADERGFENLSQSKNMGHYVRCLKD